MTHLSHGLDAAEQTHEADEPGDAETDDERPLHLAKHVDASALFQQMTSENQSH